MVSNPGNRWAVAGTTFAVWGLVAASAVYWGIKLSSGPSAIPTAPAVRTTPPPDAVAVGRVLGANPAPAAAPTPALASRFQLFGVVAGPDGGGAALLSVDGKPPRPYRVGAAVDENLVLQSVETKRVTLAASMNAQPALSLDMPARR